MLYQIAKRISREPVNAAITQFCGDLKGAGRLLCIGAGGPIESLIRSATTGRAIEIVTTDIDASRRPMVIDDICDSKLEDASFTAIIAAEVFEHLKDPWRARQEIKRLLAPGGRLMISTPFLFMIHDAPHDYFRFTRFGLEELFSEFEQVEIVERGGFLDALALLILRLPLTGGPAARIAAWALTPLVLVLRNIVRWTPRAPKAWLIPVGYVLTATRPS